jgi:hypothetical protein
MTIFYVNFSYEVKLINDHTIFNGWEVVREMKIPHFIEAIKFRRE